MEIATFDQLTKAYTLESKTNEIQPLPKDFYKMADEYVTRLKQEENTEKNEKQTESVRHVVLNLKAKRRQKILLYLAYGKKMPEKVPEEEETFFSKIKKIMAQDEEFAKTTKLRITADIPEIVTPTGKKIGPYNKNQTVNVDDEEDADFLVKNKIGEILN